MNESTVAWAAGLFDGEGSALISHTSTSYAIVVTIANTNREAISFFHRNWGGRVRVRTVKEWVERYGRTANHDSYRVDFDHAEAERLLLDLYPYLVVKKKEAEIVLRALVALPKQEVTSGSRFPKKTPPGSGYILASYYEELRNLKNS